MTEKIIDLSVKEWLLKYGGMPVLVNPETSLKEVALLMIAEECRDAYVEEQGIVKGHLTFNNVINHLFAQERPIHTHRQLFARITEPNVGELMDPHFAYCREDEALCEVVHRQLERNVDDLLVLAADDSVKGVISLNDLVKASLL